MKRSFLLTLSLLLLLGVAAYAVENTTWGMVKELFDEETAAPAARIGPGARVVGGGKVFNFIGDSDVAVTINAHRDKNGQVKGEAHWVESVIFDIQIHQDIDCMYIDGNFAVISGPIKQCTFLGGPCPPDWTRWLYWIEDNGQGAGAPPDLIEAGPHPEPCGEMLIPGLDGEFRGILDGNVQIFDDAN